MARSREKVGIRSAKRDEQLELGGGWVEEEKELRKRDFYPENVRCISVLTPDQSSSESVMCADCM